MQPDLFDMPREVVLGDGACVLTGLALEHADALLSAIAAIEAISSFRHLETPGGHRMSVAMTNCGDVGWVSDRSGYRYARTDPLTDRRWPAMPPLFTDLARRAATAAGLPDPRPDVCLLNRYVPGTRLTLHQDRDERDHRLPIVSVSLGVPATFLWGGLSRRDRPRRIPLVHGDVVVWGGASRLVYHGVDTLRPAHHPATGDVRFNLTFRRAT